MVGDLKGQVVQRTSPTTCSVPEALAELVARGRRRLLLQRCAAAMLWGGVGSLLAAAVVVVLDRLVAPSWSKPIVLAVVLGAGPLLALALTLAVKTLSRLQAARGIEKHYALKERLSSILLLEGERVHPEAARALLRDGERHLSGVDIRAALPWRRPRALPWFGGALLLLIAVQAFLPSFDLFGFEKKREQLAAETKRIDKRERELRKRLAGIRKLAEREKIHPETKKLLEKLAERKRLSNRSKPADRKRQALVDMQKMRDDLNRQRQRPEMKRLGSILEKVQSVAENPQTKEGKQLESALRKGDLETAANALEKLASSLDKAMRENPDSESAKALARDLERLMKKLGKLPSLDGKLADALKKLGASNLGDLSKLTKGAAADLSNLARLMRERDLIDSALDQIKLTEDELAALPKEWPKDNKDGKT